MLSFSLCPAACAKGPQQTTSKRTSKPRPVSTLSNGELLFGVVAQVGGAASAWLDIGVTTSTGKPVNARLRLGKRKPPEVGTSMPVVVHRLNAPAARVEVRRPPDSNSVPLTRKLDQLTTGDEVQGRIRACVPAGAVVDVGAYYLRGGQSVRCTALLRRKHFAPTWASPLDKVRMESSTKVLQVGEQLDLFIREVHPGSGRFFVDAAPVTKEEIEAEQMERRKRRNRGRRQRRRRSLDSLQVDSEISGVVGNVVKFGVFVDVGVNTDGLIHYSDMGKLNWEWKNAFEQDVEVVVRVKSIADERLNLEFVRFEGEDPDTEAVNPALERPEARKTEEVERGSLDEESKAEKKQELDYGNEDGDGFDKFTDDYFEEKYLM